MECPKCSAKFGATPDEIGRVECPQCGARLRSKGQAVFKARGAPAAGKPPPGGVLDGQGAAKAQAQTRKQDPDATVRRGDIDPALLRRASARVAGSAPGTAVPPATLETLLAEVRMVRKAQEEILSILKGKASPPSGAEPETSQPAPRTRRS